MSWQFQIYLFMFFPMSSSDAHRSIIQVDWLCQKVERSPPTNLEMKTRIFAELCRGLTPADNSPDTESFKQNPVLSFHVFSNVVLRCTPFDNSSGLTFAKSWKIAHHKTISVLYELIIPLLSSLCFANPLHLAHNWIIHVERLCQKVERCSPTKPYPCYKK